jgi:predicted lipoprotein with Yx(FWY)xxD motif
LKRTIILLAVIAAALATAGIATAGGRGAKVNLRNTKIGKVLVNSRGFTLYEFARDARNKDNCVSIPGCKTVWPLAYTSGKPIAGKGVRRSLLGTITLSNGRRQVTYAGHPLYTYIGDGAAGNTFGAGILQAGGRWYALNAAGHRVSKK